MNQIDYNKIYERINHKNEIIFDNIEYFIFILKIIWFISIIESLYRQQFSSFYNKIMNIIIFVYFFRFLYFIYIIDFQKELYFLYYLTSFK